MMTAERGRTDGPESSDQELLLDTYTTRSGSRLHRVVMWYMVTGNRWSVSGVTLLAVFVITVLLGQFGPVPVQSFVSTGVTAATAVLYLFTGIITIVTIVTSINQLILSYEIGPIEKQQTALDKMLQHRQKVRQLTGTAELSMYPTTFVDTILAGIAEQVQKTQDAVTDTAGDHGKAIMSFTDEMDDAVRRIRDALDGTDFGELSMVLASMQLNGNERINRIQNIQAVYEDMISEQERDAVKKLEDLLRLAVTAIAYFKIGYLQSQFIRFSQSLLYVGLPSLVLTFWLSQFAGPNAFPGATLGFSNHLLIASLAFTAAIVPFVLLTAYVSRLVTLSNTTIFTGPFRRGRDRRLVSL